MPLPFLALTGLPMLLHLGWMHMRFSQLHQLERLWIALDNASTALGRSERDAYQALSDAQAQLKRLDATHHVWHACARLPLSQVKCQPPDQLQEQALRALGQAAWARAVGLWQAGALRAAEQGRRLGVPVEWRRAHSPPVRSRACQVCGLTVGWQSTKGAPTQVSARWADRRPVASISLVGEFRSSARWEYQVRGGE